MRLQSRCSEMWRCFVQRSATGQRDRLLDWISVPTLCAAKL
jgi:hypothetical protein